MSTLFANSLLWDAWHNWVNFISSSYQPVSDMINEMLFEHKAPPLYHVKQGLFEGLSIDTEPFVKHLEWFDVFCFLVDLLIRIDLTKKKKKKTELIK